MTGKQAQTFGPYSPVRQAGNLYFTAGHLGVDMATKTVEPDIRIQTAHALDALAETLASVGLTLNDVVKTTIFVTNMSDFAAINEVYIKRFSEPRPARSTVAVKELPRVATNGAAKIEIEAIAARQES